MEYIKIDPIEELLKAIGIVRGEQEEQRLRYLVYMILFDKSRRNGNGH